MCLEPNITLPSELKDMSELFKGRRWNPALDISTWDVQHVENMSSMFEGVTDFDADISGWNVEKVKDMSFMFKNAPKFSADISGWKTSSLENVEEIFVGATAHDSDLTSWDISKVTGTIDPTWFGSANTNCKLPSGVECTSSDDDDDDNIVLIVGIVVGATLLIGGLALALKRKETPQADFQLLLG